MPLLSASILAWPQDAHGGKWKENLHHIQKSLNASCGTFPCLLLLDCLLHCNGWLNSDFNHFHMLFPDRFFLRNDTKIRNKRNDHQICPFFLRNEYLLMKSLKILFAQWEFTLVTIKILFAQWKIFLRNETFDSILISHILFAQW